MDANDFRMLLRPLGALAGAVILAGCGGGDGTAEGTTDDVALVCPAGGGSVRDDPGGDVRVISIRGPEQPARLPSADLVSAAIRRGEGGVVCVTFRTAEPVRLGSGFALSTRQAAGAPGSFDEERYEIQLTPDGEVNVSRPHGEPRYPVRAEVVRDGVFLKVAMETLLRPDESFGWRAESSYLPDFPLGDIYVDAMPNGDAWLQVPATSGR